MNEFNNLVLNFLLVIIKFAHPPHTTKKSLVVKTLQNRVEIS
jgi:hypothetical protein